MGLGKTIEMLSLVHTLRAPQGTPNRSTLVVAPMSIISQWKSEADKSSNPGTLKTLIYYGSDKSLDLPSLCASPAAPDVIVTSYGVVLSEWTSGKTSEGIFGTEWFRVILDEAHSIKNRLSKTARACYEIKAERRWVLTGTPIVNKLEDLFSLVHFLGVEPWSLYSYWRTFITVPFESKDYLRALDVVQTILEPLVLRRTKDMKDSEGSLFDLLHLIISSRQSHRFPTRKGNYERISRDVSSRTRDLHVHLHTSQKNIYSSGSIRHCNEELYYDPINASSTSTIMLSLFTSQTP